MESVARNIKRLLFAVEDIAGMTPNSQEVSTFYFCIYIFPRVVFLLSIKQLALQDHNTF